MTVSFLRDVLLVQLPSSELADDEGSTDVPLVRTVKYVMSHVSVDVYHVLECTIGSSSLTS